jgi:hypothetical protein
MAVSRKKYQEALRVLKSVCRDAKLPMTQRLRAAELILLVYGVPVPEGGYGTAKRNKQVIKTLVEERSFEKRVQQQITDNVRTRVMEEAQAKEETRVDAQTQARDFLRLFSAKIEAEAAQGQAEARESQEAAMDAQEDPSDDAAYEVEAQEDEGTGEIANDVK